MKRGFPGLQFGILDHPVSFKITQLSSVESENCQI